MATAFGPSNTYLLLHLLYGSKYSATEAPSALALYCPYILLLATNGILECFVHAVSRGSELKYGHFALVGITGVQTAATLGLVTSHGTSGMILADGLGMALRVLYCCVYVRQYSAKGESGSAVSLRQALPSRWTLLALAFASLLSGLSQGLFFGRGFFARLFAARMSSFLRAAGLHIAINGLVFLTCLIVMLRTERAVISSLGQRHTKKTV